MTIDCLRGTAIDIVSGCPIKHINGPKDQQGCIYVCVLGLAEHTVESRSSMTHDLQEIGFSPCGRKGLWAWQG